MYKKAKKISFLMFAAILFSCLNFVIAQNDQDDPDGGTTPAVDCKYTGDYEQSCVSGRYRVLRCTPDRGECYYNP